MTHRISSSSALAGSVLALCMAAAIPPRAWAVPEACPIENEPIAGGLVSSCRVTDGDARLDVLARGDTASTDGLLVTRLFDGTTFHMLEAFFVFDVASGIPPDTRLVSATFDTATLNIEIVVEFLDIETDTIPVATATANFQLDGLGVTEMVAVESTVSEAFTGRLYAVTDFDLNGSNDDDTAVGGLGGITFTDGDGLTRGTFAVTSGSSANAFQVSECCNLFDALSSDQFLVLTNMVDSGPADLQSAFSWDKSFNSGGDTLTTTINKTVGVPEPGTGLLHGASLAALAGLAGCRRGRQSAH